ncbi:hypothetical protein [Psychroflexus montanilacus]|uniref:hypothetical protein n=1 Tax=Psychroflexus montanilacus TaxID=2873598 RepID=UPI001CCE274F|nr:hypothetical protein [Psychroflexus montanilacus]MBZ9650711.1 hypothetical protein [Psychroflexus montanilacus]
MGFLQSAINQVGRDMGRVVSNTVFKDRHSIPIRRARSKSAPHSSQGFVHQKAQPIQEVKDEFEKAISFKTGYRPTTLISKLGGAYVVIKNEAQAFVEDGYLDVNESQQLFEMMKQFVDKCGDVEDVIGFTEEEDAKVYKQLENITISTKEVFVDVLNTSAKACRERSIEFENQAKALNPEGFGRFVGLHLIWMPRYAKGGEKKVNRAIIANILDVVTLTFPITRSILLLVGIVSYPGELSATKQAKENYRLLAEQERNRAATYEELIKSNS